MSSENASQKEYKDPETVVVQDAENIYRPDVDTSGIDERKLMRRIDWHVVPWLAVLYLLNFLDRGNIGNAKVCRHLPESLRERSTDRGWAASCII